jgi:hypothetical protein
MQINQKNINLIIVKMRRILLYTASIIVFYFLVQSCDSKYSKKNHLNTLQVDNHLFYEIYKITSGGALASDTYSYYLTDSVNFRKYVGTIYYDDEHLNCKSIDSNRILVYRAKRNNEHDTLEKKIYILSDLKKEGKFE